MPLSRVLGAYAALPAHARPSQGPGFGVAKVHVCPEIFHAHLSGCYLVSETRATFTECQRKVCPALGGSLATITDESTNEFLRQILGDDIGFFGLFEHLPDASGDWRWVSGSSSFSRWSPGEPNNFCIDEDCAAFLPGSDEWFDVSCGIRVSCICQYGGEASPEYLEAERFLNASQGPSAYRACRSKGSVRGGRCWWMRSGKMRAAYILLGLPCLGALVLALLSTCGVVTGLRADFEVLTSTMPEYGESAYGFLLDKGERDPSMGDTDSTVQLWIARGACGAMLYAFALLALAATTFLHVNGNDFGFLWDAFESFLLFVCKLAVALSAGTVNANLSTFAQSIAGSWILVLAASKACMAFCDLVLVFVYLTMHVKGPSSTTLCWVGYAFVWSLLLSMVLQSVAGFALYRLHERAASAVGDQRVFSKVLSCWWGALVGGTFGAGLGLWLCGLLFVFDNPRDGIDPYKSVPTAYFGAACCQLIAGISMAVSNQRIMEYFASPSGKQAVELAASTAGPVMPPSASADSELHGLLRS